MIGNVLSLGALLGPFLVVFIVDPNVLRKEKEASKPPKVMMREHKGVEFIPYHYNLKG